MYLHFDTARLISRIRNGELLKKKNATQNLTEYAYFYFHFRLLVSGHLQKEHEFYMNFMEGGRTVKEFCSQVCVPLLNVKKRKNIVMKTKILLLFFFFFFFFYRSSSALHRRSST